MLFATLLLALLWIIFFIGLYVFYGWSVEHEADDLLENAGISCPKRYDEFTMAFYKNRLAELARINKPASIVVFSGEEGDYKAHIFVDDQGTRSLDNNDLFDTVAGKLDFNGAIFTDGAVKIETGYGTYLCRGEVRYLEAEGERQKFYILVMKPYDVFNPQTMYLIYILIGVTALVLIIAYVFSFFASRFLTRRLKDFSHKAKRVAGGDFGVKFSGEGYDEYENLAAALNAATDNLSKSEKLQRDIVANVSHDIRTPLTMIRAYAEMIRDLPLDDKKREKTTEVIITETERLAGLVDDVLNYSRLQAGVTEFSFEPVNLANVAAEVLDRFDIARARDGIKLEREIDADTVALCDEQKIEQVLYNLIGNAINYCGEDKTVVLRVKNNDEYVRVEVTDHGKGIAEDEIGSVWERYYRSEHGSRKVVGSGLGLSICKSVLTAHNARFGVLSELGKGSTFWFELDTAKARRSDK